MTNTNKPSLGNRLATVANFHSKASTKKRSNNTLQAKLAAMHIGTKNHVYQTMNSKNKNKNKNNSMNKKTCGPEPKPKFIGTKKNPLYNNWQKCSASAAGGARRKTRRGKKSRRMTRRR